MRTSTCLRQLHDQRRRGRGCQSLDYVHCLVTAFGDHGNFQEKDLVSREFSKLPAQRKPRLSVRAESVTEANVSCMSPFPDGGQIGRVSLRAVRVGAIHVQ